MGGQFDGRLEAVDGSVLAVTGIGGTPDDGDEGLLDLELLVDGVQGPQESGGVTRDHTGELGSPGLGVIGSGVE